MKPVRNYGRSIPVFFEKEQESIELGMLPRQPNAPPLPEVWRKTLAEELNHFAALPVSFFVAA